MVDTISQEHLDAILARNPQLHQAVADYVKTIPEDVRQKNVEAVQKFISGELTWAEIKNIPKELLSQLARVAYTQFKQGDLKTAETLFKGLAVLDHNNWYYRSALGAILQKKKLYDQAIQEYDIALELNPDEITTLVNRGQCYMQIGDADTALADFKKISTLNLPPENPWLKRAQALQRAIVTKQYMAKQSSVS